jgi:hypothetical protein
MPGDGELMLLRSTGNTEERIYRVCSFLPGAVVPRVQLVSAVDDDQVIALANDIDPSAMREVWDRHRLVVEIPANRPARNGDIEVLNLN